jgi:hypothetical protein
VCEQSIIEESKICACIYRYIFYQERKKNEEFAADLIITEERKCPQTSIDESVYTQTKESKDINPVPEEK